MDANEFATLVRKQCPPEVPKELLERALSRHVERSAGLYRNNVQDVIQDARAFMDLQGGGGQVAAVLAPHSGAIGELSEDMAEGIREWVEGWRRRLGEHYGVSLPFRESSETISWLESVASDGEEMPRDDPERMREAFEDPHTREFLGIRDPRTKLDVSLRVPMLQVPDYEARIVRHVAVHPTGPWGPLPGEIAEVEKATGFAGWKLVMYILAGWRPRLPPATIRRSHYRGGRIPGGAGIQGPWSVQVTFFTPELTLDQLRDVYREIRTDWGVTGDRLLTERQRLVLRIVREMGGQPGPGEWTEFWQRVGQRMEEETDGAVSYTTPQGPHKLYKVARERMASFIGDQPTPSAEES